MDAPLPGPSGQQLLPHAATSSHGPGGQAEGSPGRTGEPWRPGSLGEEGTGSWSAVGTSSPHKSQPGSPLPGP